MITRVTPEMEQRNAAMLQAWLDGETVTAIAARFGLSLSWTGLLLRQLGAEMPTHRRGVKRELDVDEVVRQYNAGLTVRAIAEAQSVSYSKIYRLLQDEGVQMRPRGGGYSASPG